MNIVVCVHSFRLVLSIDTQSYIMCNPPQTDSQDMKREPPDQMGFPTLTKPRDFRIGTEQLCFNLTWGKTLVSCDFSPSTNPKYRQECWQETIEISLNSLIIPSLMAVICAEWPTFVVEESWYCGWHRWYWAVAWILLMGSWLELALSFECNRKCREKWRSWRLV